MWRLNITEKEILGKELLNFERSQNESSLRVKELNLKYQSHINDLEKKVQEVNFALYKKEAMIAKLTTENEFLNQENFRIKSAQNINDSILMLPDTWFIDIQSAKKQREAVHEATKKLIDEMAEEKAKGKEDLLLNNISLLEEKNKKLYLDMYDNIGMELNKYEAAYSYKKNKLEADERKKDEFLKQRKDEVKAEFKYKLDTADQKTYEEFLEDQIKKQSKFSKEFKIKTESVDQLLTKYKI